MKLHSTNKLAGRTLSGVPIEATISGNNADVCMGNAEGGDAVWCVNKEDCNEILQFFYALRASLGGPEGTVKDTNPRIGSFVASTHLESTI
jgi:hypothetical protein